MKKTILLLLTVVAFSFSLLAQNNNRTDGTQTAAILKNSIDSFSYAAGFNIATSMKQQGVTEVNAAIVQRAMEDVLTNRAVLLNEQECNMTLQQKLQEFAQKKMQVERERGQAFLGENKKRNGVISLPNGLQYEVMKLGERNAPLPKLNDTVVVHYSGTLIDGTKFDASTDRGEPATFALTDVIRGWTEILQLMPKGSKWKVFVPGDLAYGERGRGPVIGPNATLVFEIELLDIKHPAQQ